MGERFRTRALVVPRALVRRFTRAAAGGEPRRILVAHNLLLGDTLMLTPLLAKLRERYPEAGITLLAAPSAVPLYEKRPFGVRALPFRPADSATTEALLREDRRPDRCSEPSDDWFGCFRTTCNRRRFRSPETPPVRWRSHSPTALADGIGIALAVEVGSDSTTGGDAGGVSERLHATSAAGISRTIIGAFMQCSWD